MVSLHVEMWGECVCVCVFGLVNHSGDKMSKILDLGGHFWSP